MRTVHTYDGVTGKYVESYDTPSACARALNRSRASVQQALARGDRTNGVYVNRQYYPAGITPKKTHVKEYKVRGQPHVRVA